MKIIKRYANRKLYDTSTSKTVTLNEIAQMVKDGDEIKVIDSSEEGVDITHRVLAQIFIQENWDTKQAFLQKYLLEGLIKEGGDKFGELIKKMLLAGVGMASLTQEKMENLVNELIKRGELAEDEKAKFVKTLIGKMEQGSNNLKTMFEKAVSGNGDKKEQKEYTLEELNTKIEELTKAIEELKTAKTI